MPSPNPPASAKRWVWALALIATLLAGGVLRAARLHDETSHPLGRVPTADEATYDRWAQRIAAGEAMGVPYQAPLHAYSLALWHRVAEPEVARHLQRAQTALLGLATIGLTFWLGRRVSGSRRVGLLAAGAVALHQPLVYYETTLLRDGPAAFATVLGALGVVALLRCRGATPSRWIVIAVPIGVGITWGVASLLRENLLFVALAIALWMALSGGRPARSRAAWLLLGTLLPLLPWLGHNARVEGHLSLLPTWNGGTVFYLANRADHRGPGYAPPSFLAAGNAEAEIQGFTREAERLTGRSFTPHEVSAFWLRRGLAAVASDPGLYLQKVAQRSLLFLVSEEFVHARDPRLDADRSWVLRLPLPGFGLLVGFAIGGFIANRHAPGVRAVAVGIAALLAATVPVAFATRYRLPAVPLVAVLAAIGVRDIGRGLAHSGARAAALRQLAAAGAVGVALHLVPVEHDASQGRANRAAAWLALGSPAEAFEEIGAIDARHRGRRWGEVGRALLRRGDDALAERAFRSAIAREPGAAAWRIGLGDALGRQERWREAVVAYESALDRDPGNERAAQAAANARARSGR